MRHLWEVLPLKIPLHRHDVPVLYVLCGLPSEHGPQNCLRISFWSHVKDN